MKIRSIKRLKVNHWYSLTMLNGQVLDGYYYVDEYYENGVFITRTKPEGNIAFSNWVHGDYCIDLRDLDTKNKFDPWIKEVTLITKPNDLLEKGDFVTLEDELYEVVNRGNNLVYLIDPKDPLQKVHIYHINSPLAYVYPETEEVGLNDLDVIKELRIVEFLDAIGWSQARFAKELGVLELTVSNWLNNKSKPRATNVFRIMKLIEEHRYEA